MKKASIESLRRASEGGARIVDKDGLEVRFPKRPAPEPPPKPQPEEKKPAAPDVAGIVDRLATAVSALLKTNQVTTESISETLAAIAAQKSEPRQKQRPVSYEVDVVRGKNGKMKSLIITQR